MIDTQIARAARPLLGLSLTLAFLAPFSAAQAAQTMFPKDKPEVVFEVPGDWTVQNTAGGLEMSSPEKNSIIVGHIIGRDKAFIDKWAGEAAAKLKTYGVAFDQNGKPPPSASAGIATIGGSTSAFTTDAGSFSFSGAPSLAPPGGANSNNPVKPSENSLESLTGHLPAPTAGGTSGGGGASPKLPFKAVQYYGTTMNGKPVDVQLVIYNLPDQRLFVMMQESGPEDGRAVAIAQSVKSAKGK